MKRQYFNMMLPGRFFYISRQLTRLRKFQDRNSEIKEFQLLRGYCHLKRDDLDDAIMDFKAAIRSERGGRYMACACLFQAWFKAGKGEDADECKKINSDFPSCVLTSYIRNYKIQRPHTNKLQHLS